MRLHEVRLEDCPPQPWRNGGGLTHELLVWPAPSAQPPTGSDAEGWLVRVSVAQIGRDGPFSAFPGVDRAFAVLEGTGVALTFGGGAAAEGERLLTADDEALNFPGEDAPGCRLAGGPGAATLDLNLMGRREAGRIGVRRVAAGSSLTGAHAWRGVYAHGPATLHTPAGARPLAGRSLCWSDDAQALAQPWTLHSAHRAFYLSWTPQEPPR